MSLRILYIGAGNGTSRHRSEALRRLGHSVDHVASGIPPRRVLGLLYRLGAKLKRHPDFMGANRAARRAARAGLDVLWVDKGLELTAATLRYLQKKSPRTLTVSYSPDDMLNPGNQSVHYLRSIPLYDFHVTTKTYNVKELRDLGARDVLFVDNAYEPSVHRPIDLTEPEQARYGADVGFVGGYEEDRAAALLSLARRGVGVSVWGFDWHGHNHMHPGLHIRTEWLDELDYSKAVNATRINLGFLRKVNRDLQTTRSIEIPACGAFLLAERTDEHLRLFTEGEEAEFFSSFEELLQKTQYYLGHDEERRQVAQAGRRRCLSHGYSNDARLASVLATALERRGTR